MVVGVAVRKNKIPKSSLSLPLPSAEEVLLEEEDEIAEEKSPLDGAWYKRKQNLPGENRAASPWPSGRAGTKIRARHSFPFTGSCCLATCQCSDMICPDFRFRNR